MKVLRRIYQQKQHNTHLNTQRIQSIKLSIARRTVPEESVINRMSVGCGQ